MKRRLIYIWKQLEHTSINAPGTDRLIIGRRYNSIHATGRPEEAQRRQKGDRKIARIKGYFSNRTQLLRGDRWPTTVHSLRKKDDASAFLLPYMSNHRVTNLLDDTCATILDMFKTWRWIWRPWQYLSALCATFKRPSNHSRPPLSLSRRPAQFYVRTMEKQK